MIKTKLDVLCVKKIKLTANEKAAACKIQRAPYLCTKCPTVSSATILPIAPMLRIDPNSPLVSCKLAFTSGNRGTQDIIKTPKRKKSALIRLSSTLLSMLSFKTEHSLALCGRRLVVDLMDRPRQIVPINDSSTWFDHHRLKP